MDEREAPLKVAYSKVRKPSVQSSKMNPIPVPISMYSTRMAAIMFVASSGCDRFWRRRYFSLGPD